MSRWTIPLDLKPGDRIRHESGQYKHGETTLTVRDHPYRETASWIRVPIAEWTYWTLRVRAGSALRVVGRVSMTKPDR